MQIQRKDVTITQKEAEEYCAYKRQKKISEIMAAMRRSGSVLTGTDSVPRLIERATRLRQVSIRMRPTDISQRGEPFLRGPLLVDCTIGGNGESFLKVKTYEAKCALKAGAEELTLLLTPSLVASSRYQALRKELKKLRKATKGTTLKACVDKVYPRATMSRLARLCGEMRIDYFSVPYFAGCQQLLLEPIGRCQIEVSDVNTLESFKEMAGAGIGRIITNRAWEIYTEWLAEAETIQAVKEEKPNQEPSCEEEKGEEKGEEKKNEPPATPLLLTEKSVATTSCEATVKA